MKEEVAVINSDILRSLVGDMISRKSVNFTTKILDSGSVMSERSRFIANNFIQNYLKKVLNLIKKG